MVKRCSRYSSYCCELSTLQRANVAIPRLLNVISKPTYTYEQVAERINEVLGETPSLASLRAAAAEATRTTSTNSRVRLTAGMPAPLAPRSSPALFDRLEIERWLRHHPRLKERQAYAELVRQVATEAGRRRAIREARTRGLSWRRITDALTDATGTAHSHQGVFKAFRDLD